MIRELFVHRPSIRISRALAAAFCVAVPSVGAAQAPNSGFEKGTRLLSVGAMTGGGYDGTGLGGIVEWGVGALGSATLSVGAFAGVQRQSTGAGTLEVSTTAIPVMGVANAHFPVRANPRLDLYTGASLGLVRVSVESTSALVGDDDDSRTDTGVGFQIGARYRLASRLGVMGQIGLGDLPLVFAGASLRF